MLQVIAFLDATTWKKSTWVEIENDHTQVPQLTNKKERNTFPFWERETYRCLLVMDLLLYHVGKTAFSRQGEGMGLTDMGF